MRSATGLRKKAAAATAALQAEVRDLSERLEALAASCKRREKAQGMREKTNALAQSMEIKRIQVLLAAVVAHRLTVATHIVAKGVGLYRPIAKTCWSLRCTGIREMCTFIFRRHTAQFVRAFVFSNGSRCAILKQLTRSRSYSHTVLVGKDFSRTGACV